jgi:hypothetical protein
MDCREIGFEAGRMMVLAHDRDFDICRFET